MPPTTDPKARGPRSSPSTRPAATARPSRRPALAIDPLEGRALLNGSPSLIGDYDGDGRTDPALYRFDPETGDGVFEILDSATGTPRFVRIGGLSPRDLPVAGDFDGDGRTDPSVVRPLAVIGGGTTPNASVWVSLRSSDGRRVETPFGAAGTLDLPAPADYDGDGRTDLATFRADSDLTPGAAEWFVLPSGGGPAFRVAFGAAGGRDLPAPADFDGDGRADIATFRPSPTPQDGPIGAAQWFILPSAPNAPGYRTRSGGVRLLFGAPGNADQPAPADLNGDGRAEVIAFRSDGDLSPGSASWFILPSHEEFPAFGDGFPVPLGPSGSIAAVADSDGDGRTDYAAFDPSSSTWTIAPTTPDGRPSSPPILLPFGLTTGGAVPVLSPLYFRLLASGNLSPSIPPDPPAIVTVDAPPGTIPVYGYEVVDAFPHDAGAFTQGLAFDSGRLVEGTGLHGASRLREVEVETGRVLREVALPDSAFGEGVAPVGDRIIQLTWRGGVGYVYDRDTFRLLDTVRYAGEGWGLTFDGTHLILSDGTPTLRVLDPATFRVARTVQVTDDGLPLGQINELEFIGGELFANIWKADRIARIDPDTGLVTGWVDLSGLRPPQASGPEAVLNGIAFDPSGDRLFVTGKNWPTLFQIRLVAPA